MCNFRFFKNPQIYLCNFDPKVFFSKSSFFSKSTLFFNFLLLKTLSHWRPFFAVFANYALKFDLFSRKWPQILTQNPILVIFWSIMSSFGQFWSIWRKKIDLNLKKFKKYQCSKMVSKRLYGHYLRNNEQF